MSSSPLGKKPWQSDSCHLLLNLFFPSSLSKSLFKILFAKMLLMAIFRCLFPSIRVWIVTSVHLQLPSGLIKPVSHCGLCKWSKFLEEESPHISRHFTYARLYKMHRLSPAWQGIFIPLCKVFFVKFETYKAIMWVMRAQTVKVFVWAKQKLLCKTVGLGWSEHFEALAQIVYPLTQILWPFVCPSAHCPGSATTSLKPNYGCKQTLKHSNHGI